MAKYLIIFLFFFAFVGCDYFQSLFTAFPEKEKGTLIREDITSNTTWTKENSPYIITQTCTIKKNCILTIEPEVELQFEKNTALICQGKLETKLSNYVTLTSLDRRESIGFWQGIIVEETKNVTFQCLKIQFAKVGILVQSAQSITIKNSQIEKNKTGLKITDSQNINILNNLIKKNTFSGIEAKNVSAFRISGNLIKQNGQYGLEAENCPDLNEDEILAENGIYGNELEPIYIH